jgi:thiol-disulfide isomerase/thioredoxin
MRNLKLLLIILVLSETLYSQTKFELIVSSSDEIDTVQFFNYGQNHFFSLPYDDTVSFTFDADNVDLYNIWYHGKSKMYRQQIWLDSGQIQIRGKIQNAKLNIDTIVNSPIHYYSKQFHQDYTHLLKTKDTLKMNEFLLEAIRRNIRNAYSLDLGDTYIHHNQNNKTNVLKLVKLLEDTPPSVRSHRFYKSINDRMAGILKMSTIDFRKYSFINRKNKSEHIMVNSATTIVDFWFTACAPCVEQHIEMNKFLTKLKDNRIDLVGVSIDESYSKWNTYLKIHDYNWRNFKIDRSHINLVDALGVQSFPTYFILNGESNVIAIYNSFSEVIKYLKL